MGGCATKPLVLKDDAEVPKLAEEPAVAAETVEPEVAGVGKEESPNVEDAEGKKSLGNLFKEKENEEAAAAAEEEKPKEDTERAPEGEEAKQEQQPTADVNTGAAATEEKQQ